MANLIAGMISLMANLIAGVISLMANLLSLPPTYLSATTVLTFYSPAIIQSDKY
jgi:hypothetical protein